MRLRIMLATWNCENQAPEKADANWDGFVDGMIDKHKDADFVIVGLQEAARMAKSPDLYVSHKLAEEIPNAVHISHRSIRGNTKGAFGFTGGDQRQQLGVIDCRKGRWEVAGAFSAKRTVGAMSEKGALACALDLRPVRRNVFFDEQQDDGDGLHAPTYEIGATRRLVFTSTHFAADAPDTQEADALATEIFTRNCIRMPGAPLGDTGMTKYDLKVGNKKMDNANWAAETEQQLRTGARNNSGLAFIMGDLNYRISTLRAAQAVRERMEQDYIKDFTSGKIRKTTKQRWEFPKQALAEAIVDAAARDRLFGDLDGFRGSYLDAQNWHFPKPTRSPGNPVVAYPSYKRAYKDEHRHDNVREMLMGFDEEARVEGTKKVYEPLSEGGNEGKSYVQFKKKRDAWDFGWLDRIGYKQFGVQDYQIQPNDVKVWEGIRAFLSDHVPVYMYIEFDYPTVEARQHRSQQRQQVNIY